MTGGRRVVKSQISLITKKNIYVPSYSITKLQGKIHVIQLIKHYKKYYLNENCSSFNQSQDG